MFDLMAGARAVVERALTRRALLGVAAALVALLPSGVVAQSFPTKPVRIIIGPSPDAVARVVGQYLQESWGQAVVIEPRTGAGGQIAAQAVASADPDGHMLLFATPSYTLNTAMGTASYDILKQFAPAALIGTGSYTVVVHPSVPARTFGELMAYIKANPGKINCASAGIGTAPHLACETLNTLPGVKVVHVPYRGVNEAMNGVVAGQVQMFMSVSLVAQQQMQAGTVRGLASSGPRRSALLPDLPTLVEEGYPTFIFSGWNGLLATAGTPRPILDKVNASVQRATETSGIRERLLALGQEFVPLDPDGFAGFVRDDIARWTVLVDAVGRDKLAPR